MKKLDYEGTLRLLQGLLGQHVNVRISAPGKDSDYAAGFAGTLQRGTGDAVARLLKGEEAILFEVGDPLEDGAWFALEEASFKTALIVDEGPALELAIRVRDVDVNLWPDEREMLLPERQPPPP
jgi:hypothetical protein